MTSVLILLRGILNKLRSSRLFFHHFFRHWGLFVAFLGRRLCVWRQGEDKKRGKFPKVKKAEHSSPGPESSLDSREYAIVSTSASSIPESASNPSIRVVGSANQRPRSSTTPSVVQELAEPSSTTIDSIHSVSISPPTIQTHWCESLHTLRSQPTQIPGDFHGQSESGSSVPLPREHSSRSPSPTSRAPQLPRLDTDITNIHPPTHVDDRISPINPHSASSHTHAQLILPTLHGHPGGQSSTTVAVGVVDSSPNPLTLGPSTDHWQPPLTDEPYTIGSPTGHLSPVADTPDAREGSSQHSPIAPPSSTTSCFDLPEGRILQLITSEHVSRHTKAVTVLRERTHFNMPPLTTTFFHVPVQIGLEQGSFKEGCAPWVPATHPDGALYFFDQDRRLFTDTNMHEPVLREEIEDFYHCLQNIVRRDGLVIPSKSYDLVLDITQSEDGQTSWSYYYACHETRCLFWLGPTEWGFQIFGVKSALHVKHSFEALYWTHWSLFPTVFEGRRLDHAVIDELVGMLSHGCTVVLTSNSSTQPFDADTMQKMLALAQNAKKSDVGLVYHTAGVTRILSFLARWRFLHFHGQPNARLKKNQRVYTNPRPKRTILITLLSPLFFFAPDSYRFELEDTWVDEVFILADWRNLITRLSKGWEQLILASTVMLSVNVGFLAIPGVVITNLNSNITNTSQVVMLTSPAQIASCMSIVASVGSIVIGLILINDSSPEQDARLPSASHYLRQKTHRHFGLEPISIIFGLPWGLLMWAMTMFSIALLLFCFTISNPTTRIFVAVTSVMVVALICWCNSTTLGLQGVSSNWMWPESLRLHFARALHNLRRVCHPFFEPIARRESPPSVRYGLSQDGSSQANLGREIAASDV
ncbi:hypothetical protein EI94DRAFT_1737414 [Lactarius quietus]|nr:hypothetical protein EI94DRAFT_1737414 [Lactarius quietus]